MESRFFLYGKSKKGAIKRFCDTSGVNCESIISIIEIGE
jgi:hypothetical protein